MLPHETMLRLFEPPVRPAVPKIGFELEAFVFDRETCTPLPFEGERGLRRLLELGAELTGGVPMPGQGGKKLELPGGAYLSLEPAGQLEYSSVPSATFAGCLSELDRHRDIVRELCERLALRIVYAGVNPIHDLQTIALPVATERYRLMDLHFGRVGTTGRRMMRQTSSLQVTFDYATRAEGEELLRAALHLAPVVAAMFGNAPYLEGKRTAYQSYRVPIWAGADPSRCGTLPGFESPDFGWDDYLRHMLQAPMFFFAEGGKLVDAQLTTFDTFLRDGHDGREATFQDLALHNSTMFPEVRPKHTVELRSVDTQDPARGREVIALTSGLLMSGAARRDMLELLGGRITTATHAAISDDLGRRGLAADVGGVPARALALELIAIARRHLPASLPDGDAAAAALAPLDDAVRAGRTPAGEVVARFGDDPLAWVRAGGAP